MACRRLATERGYAACVARLASDEAYGEVSPARSSARSLFLEPFSGVQNEGNLAGTSAPTCSQYYGAAPASMLIENRRRFFSQRRCCNTPLRWRNVCYGRYQNYRIFAAARW